MIRVRIQSMHTRGWRRTGHIHRAAVTAALIRRVPDAQLPKVIPTPALDPASSHYRAGVGASQGDGDGGDA